MNRRKHHPAIQACRSADAAKRALCAVAAYVRVKQADGRASLNLLWALESALTGVPWQVVARERRLSLLLAMEEAETGCS